MLWMPKTISTITGLYTICKRNFIVFKFVWYIYSSSHIGSGLQSESSISRHYLYAKHFPLSQDDPLSQHDCNQRYILLFGVGKERDEKKHAVKKMSKGI